MKNIDSKVQAFELDVKCPYCGSTMTVESEDIKHHFITTRFTSGLHPLNGTIYDSKDSYYFTCPCCKMEKYITNSIPFYIKNYVKDKIPLIKSVIQKMKIAHLNRRGY